MSYHRSKFIPGGRYLYYAGRPNKFFNNCYLLKAEEDTREDWADISWKSESCLMTGGGIGIDYSIYREEGRILNGTGGLSSGPIPKMMMVNEIGRRVMQGGSRRSAIYASLNWKHPDIDKFLSSKNWYDMPVGTTGFSIGQIKEQDFNFIAPLDMTNVSVNYDTEWLLNYWKTGMLAILLELMSSKHYLQRSRGFRSISLTRKRKHFVTLVRRLHPKMILMFVILALLIWAGLMT